MSRSEELTKTLGLLNKQFGKGSIGSLDELGEKDVEFIDSGSMSLNGALNGGWAKNRIIELLGWESSGKTTIALEACAAVQAEGGTILYVDAEYALDPAYCKALGLDMYDESFILYQPENFENGMHAIIEMVRSGGIDLFVLDSVASLRPKKEIDGEVGDQVIGLQAKLMSQSMPKLIQLCQKTETTGMFINQFRHKIGVMMGDTKTTPGGNALKFYASQRATITRIGSEKDSDGDRISNQTKIEVTKNKVGKPFQKTTVIITFGEGLDRVKEAIGLGIQFGVIKRSGSWFSYIEENGEAIKLGQGQEKVKTMLIDNPELLDTITDRVIAASEETAD